MSSWNPNREEWLRERAAELFIERTGAEMMLSRRMRQELPHITFHEQQVLFGYIPDFFFPDNKLIVELDGSFHQREGGPEYDRLRDALMAEHGYKTLRFSNDEVARNCGLVVSMICLEAGIDKRPLPKAGPSKKKKKGAKSILAAAREHLNFRD